MAKKSESDDVHDNLADTLLESLNKENKDGGKIAFFLNDEEDPSQIVDWVSTGNSMVDLDISNRPHGGVPVGRITELTGLEASGKSLMGAHLLAETQKKGGVAVFIDTESSVSPEFLSAIGVDIAKMLYVSVNTVEEVFDTVESIVAKVRKANNNRLVTILVDSVAAASTSKELASDHGQDGYATGKAIIISKAMRKITAPSAPSLGIRGSWCNPKNTDQHLHLAWLDALPYRHRIWGTLARAPSAARRQALDQRRDLVARAPWLTGSTCLRPDHRPG